MTHSEEIFNLENIFGKLQFSVFYVKFGGERQFQ